MTPERLKELINECPWKKNEDGSESFYVDSRMPKPYDLGCFSKLIMFCDDPVIEDSKCGVH